MERRGFQPPRGHFSLDHGAREAAGDDAVEQVEELGPGTQGHPQQDQLHLLAMHHAFHEELEIAVLLLRQAGRDGVILQRRTFWNMHQINDPNAFIDIFWNIQIKTRDKIRFWSFK